MSADHSQISERIRAARERLARERIETLIEATRHRAWWEQSSEPLAGGIGFGCYNPADPNSHSSTHRCCADQPPIDEDAWIRYGQVTDTAGQRYTQYGQPITTRPADRYGDPT